jgi:hypothetical protein
LRRIAPTRRARKACDALSTLYPDYDRQAERSAKAGARVHVDFFD